MSNESQSSPVLQEIVKKFRISKLKASESQGLASVKRYLAEFAPNTVDALKDKISNSNLKKYLKAAFLSEDNTVVYFAYERQIQEASFFSQHAAFFSKIQVWEEKGRIDNIKFPKLELNLFSAKNPPSEPVEKFSVASKSFHPLDSDDFLQISSSKLPICNIQQNDLPLPQVEDPFLLITKDILAGKSLNDITQTSIKYGDSVMFNSLLQNFNQFLLAETLIEENNQQTLPEFLDKCQKKVKRDVMDFPIEVSSQNPQDPNLKEVISEIPDAKALNAIKRCKEWVNSHEEKYPLFLDEDYSQEYGNELEAVRKECADYLKDFRNTTYQNPYNLNLLFFRQMADQIAHQTICYYIKYYPDKKIRDFYDHIKSYIVAIQKEGKTNVQTVKKKKKNEDS